MSCTESYNVPTVWRLRLALDSDDAYCVGLFQTQGDYTSHYSPLWPHAVPSTYFTPLAGTFAFSSSNQF